MTRAHSSSAHKLLTLRIHIYPQSGGRPGHHLSHTPLKARNLILQLICCVAHAVQPARCAPAGTPARAAAASSSVPALSHCLQSPIVEPIIAPALGNWAAF